jgi:signal transduction histidine kinase
MTRKTKGTGLGLFIVEQVVTNHNANISISNNLPQGTCFEIIF